MINLTQHPASAEQLAENVFEPQDKVAVQRLLTFDKPPTARDILVKAEALAIIARNHGASYALIGGAQYLTGPLELALRAQQITPCYSFSERVSEEVIQPDGSTKKVAVFRHTAFVEGCSDLNLDELGRDE